MKREMSEEGNGMEIIPVLRSHALITVKKGREEIRTG